MVQPRRGVTFTPFRCAGPRAAVAPLTGKLSGRRSVRTALRFGRLQAAVQRQVHPPNREACAAGRVACGTRRAGPGGRRATAFGAPRAVGLGLLPKPARRPLRIRHVAITRQGESITRHADLAREREAKICYVVETIDRPFDARNPRRLRGGRYWIERLVGPVSALRSADLTIGRRTFSRRSRGGDATSPFRPRAETRPPSARRDAMRTETRTRWFLVSPARCPSC